jgi:hypothetical protein
MHQKKKKLLAILNNRRQWLREFHPPYTSAQEILMEHIVGSYLVIESSVSTSPTFIITE